MSLHDLMARRGELLERIQKQRSDIASVASTFERPASFFDKSYAFVQKTKQSPALVLTGALLFFVVFRKRLPIFKTGAILLSVAKWLTFNKKGMTR